MLSCVDITTLYIPRNLCWQQTLKQKDLFHNVSDGLKGYWLDKISHAIALFWSIIYKAIWHTPLICFITCPVVKLTFLEYPVPQRGKGVSFCKVCLTWTFTENIICGHHILATKMISSIFCCLQINWLCLSFCLWINICYSTPWHNL